jgi:predicted dehydrogenase
MKDEKGTIRRDFLGGAAAAFASTIFLSQRVFGANDRVRVALCGVRGRGKDHLHNYSKIKNVEIAAVCDVDENVVRERLAQIDRMGLPKPATYTDVRKLLENKSIDAVSIATPNHWHALMAIWACQAGKDVYVEKPCTHNIWEGKQLVAASNKYNRVVQHGTQTRSDTAVRDAVQKMRDGLIGDIYMARGLCYKWRDTIGRTPPSPVPAGVDYDLWTGPAPKHDFTRNRFHYNWHWFWDYGNGDLGNQGVHQVDVARWGMGLGLPTKVSAMGGHFMFDDDQQTPNTLTCSFEFDNPNSKRRLITFEVRHWMSNHEAQIGTPELGTPRGHNSVGDIFYGSKGYLSTGDEDAATYRAWLGKDQEPQPAVHEGKEVAHFQNFIDCVVSRKKEALQAPIEEGHISCALVHLANASYRLGRTLNFDPVTEQVINDDEAANLLRDGDRGYRAPFVVPEKI